MRRLLRSKGFFAVGTIVLAVGGTFGATRLVSSASAGVPPSQLDQIALAAAAEYGEQAPSAITYVATTRQEANTADFGGVVDSNQPSYLIVEHGHFSDPAALPPGSTAAPPSGSVLTLVVDAQTGQILDTGIMSGEPNMASLGAVQALSG